MLILKEPVIASSIVFVAKFLVFIELGRRLGGDVERGVAALRLSSAPEKGAYGPAAPEALRLTWKLRKPRNEGNEKRWGPPRDRSARNVWRRKHRSFSIPTAAPSSPQSLTKQQKRKESASVHSHAAPDARVHSAGSVCTIIDQKEPLTAGLLSFFFFFYKI